MSRSKNTVRIIGGEWRSRLLSFPPDEALRPTPDRVRETLFNWLQPVLPGARVLDLCAGSGALGFEALSRGAQQAVLVDSDRLVAESLRRAVSELGANAEVRCTDVLRYVDDKSTQQPKYDIVFVDPPYRNGLHQHLCDGLSSHGWLAPGANIYVESAFGQPDDLEVPDDWELRKRKRAGQVEYRLYSTL